METRGVLIIRREKKDKYVFYNAKDFGIVAQKLIGLPTEALCALFEQLRLDDDFKGMSDPSISDKYVFLIDLDELILKEYSAPVKGKKGVRIPGVKKKHTAITETPFEEVVESIPNTINLLYYVAGMFKVKGCFLPLNKDQMEEFRRLIIAGGHTFAMDLFDRLDTNCEFRSKKPSDFTWSHWPNLVVLDIDDVKATTQADGLKAYYSENPERRDPAALPNEITTPEDRDREG